MAKRGLGGLRVVLSLDREGTHGVKKSASVALSFSCLTSCSWISAYGVEVAEAVCLRKGTSVAQADPRNPLRIS